MLLKVRDLRVYYDTVAGVVKAVDGVSLSVERGEIVGLAGESGSGKTTMARAIMRLLPSNARIVSGEIVLDGVDVLSLSESELKDFRWKKVSMVFQGAMNALNPVLRVGEQIAEVLVEKAGYDKRRAWSRVEELFKLVGIDPSRTRDYPHEFSGGMRQRAVIAMAIALNPDLVIADEPVTALDVVVQSKILDLLKRLRDELGISVLLITHDLSVIAEACDRTAIMYAGRIVEYGSTEEVFEEPLHPYTRALISAFPSITGERRSFEPIKGDPPNMLNLPPGCAFHPRCPKAFDKCSKEVPELKEVKGRLVACHLWG